MGDENSQPLKRVKITYEDVKKESTEYAKSSNPYQIYALAAIDNFVGNKVNKARYSVVLVINEMNTFVEEI